MHGCDVLNKRGFARPYVLSEHTLVIGSSLPRNNLSMRTPFIFVHYTPFYYTTLPQGDFKKFLPIHTRVCSDST